MNTLTASGPAVDVAAAVVDRARRGDQEAFAELIRHYDRGLRALAYRLLGDRDRMDDALQDVYVKAFRALPRFRGEAKIGTWLYRITYNVCLDELDRSRKVVHLPLEDFAERPGGGAPDLDETAASRHDLAAALASLPPTERAAVLLVDADGFGYREAGKIMGIPSGTVASRLSRARAALRRALTEVEGAQA